MKIKQTLVMLFILSISTPLFATASSDCTDQYIANLRSEGYQLSKITLLSKKGVQPIKIRFVRSSEEADNVITASLRFGDNCELKSSNVISTITLPTAKKDDTSLMTQFGSKLYQLPEKKSGG